MKSLSNCLKYCSHVWLLTCYNSSSKRKWVVECFRCVSGKHGGYEAWDPVSQFQKFLPTDKVTVSRCIKPRWRVDVCLFHCVLILLLFCVYIAFDTLYVRENFLSQMQEAERGILFVDNADKLTWWISCM